MVHKGVWIQLTAGSLTGRFGRGPRYWAERMLDEGLCHVMATDAHNTSTRPPHLASAQAMVEQRLGAAEATNIFRVRPRGVIDNVSPAKLPPLPGSELSQQPVAEGLERIGSAISNADGRQLNHWRYLRRRATPLQACEIEIGRQHMNAPDFNFGPERRDRGLPTVVGRSARSRDRNLAQLLERLQLSPMGQTFAINSSNISDWH